MLNYLNLLQDVLNNGMCKEDRTGTGTISKFGGQLVFDMKKGFPLVTTKKLHLKSIIHELLWFIKGDSNVKYLQENNVTIWNEWADSNGDLGPVYGKQWRTWTDGNKAIDQLQKVINDLKSNPYSRRHIVSAWNVGDLDDMALPPCHMMFQLCVTGVNKNTGKYELSMMMYQRSADLFLGVPFNIASYALLLHMIAKVTDMTPADLIITFGDMHIYSNHVDQVKEQLSRVCYPLSTLSLPDKTSIDDFVYEDIVIEDYEHHPAIKGAVAV